KKTALRLTLHLLKQKEAVSDDLAGAILKMRKEVQYCRSCHNISDSNTCSICESPHRDNSIICVVEDIPDVLAIENTAQYKGLYHVLGGVISPIHGIGPEELHIESLVNRINSRAAGEKVAEVILALSATMEGDTTSFYITRLLKEKGIRVSTIAR